eukprot:5190839-Pleurochrysis_carterae.AAC.2
MQGRIRSAAAGVDKAASAPWAIRTGRALTPSLRAGGGRPRPLADRPRRLGALAAPTCSARASRPRP